MGFSALPLGEGLWQLSDEAGSCATLAAGRDRALLFDTLTGPGDLAAFVKSLTPLPVTVVNSHGHFDHMGCNWQFEQVYLHPADWGLLPALAGELLQAGERQGLDLSGCVKSASCRNLAPLLPGTMFDLGGLRARVVPLPGHTAGSVGLLLQEQRLLLAGDACTPQMCLFFGGAQGLGVYQDTLARLEEEPFDQLLLGHFRRPFSRRWLQTFAACAALPGSGKRGLPFTYRLLPRFQGTAYFLEVYNAQAQGPVCIILGEEEAHG